MRLRGVGRAIVLPAYSSPGSFGRRRNRGPRIVIWHAFCPLSLRISCPPPAALKHCKNYLVKAPGARGHLCSTPAVHSNHPSTTTLEDDFPAARTPRPPAGSARLTGVATPGRSPGRLRLLHALSSHQMVRGHAPISACHDNGEPHL